MDARKTFTTLIHPSHQLKTTSVSARHHVDAADGVTVRHIHAGPFEGLTKHELPAQLCVFAREVLRTEAAQPRPASAAAAQAWAMLATLRAGFAHQKLARLAAEQGMELDVGDLPRRASGRIERGAADQLFDTVRTELDDDPDNWVRWYRVARAYDYAGDRSRAREAMKRAVLLEERQ